MKLEANWCLSASQLTQIKTTRQAKTKKGDYHDQMDGSMFEKWLEIRLLPAFEAQFPGGGMILVMDNASYHHEINHEYYPQGKTPENAPKKTHAAALRKAGCTSIKVPRTVKDPAGGEKQIELNFEVPGGGSSDESTAWPNYPRGPSKEEVTKAALLYYRTHRPDV